MSDQSAPNNNGPEPVKKSHHKQVPPVIPGMKPGIQSAASDPLPGNPRINKEQKPTDKAKEATTQRRISTGPTDKAIKESIEHLYGFAAMGFSIVDPEIGAAFAKCTEPNPWGPSAPEAWVELARQYPAVRNAIASIGGVGVIGQLMAAHVPLLMVLSAKFAPQSFFGANVVPPAEGTPTDSSEEPPIVVNFPVAPDPVIVP